MTNAATTNVQPLRQAEASQDEPTMRDQLRMIMEGDSRLTQARVSREMGVSTAVLSQWLAASYSGNNAGVEGKVRQWLEAHFERLENGGLPQAPDWIDTPVSEQLLGCLRYCQLAGDIGLISGCPGLGKTKAIERWARSMPNVWVVTISPATASVHHALQEIADKTGARKLGEQRCTTAALYRAIVAKMRGTGGLLVIDESQHLSILAIEQIRSIHDATAVGLTFVGNENFYSRTAIGNNAPMLSRVISRIGKRVRLKDATTADIDAVLTAWNITDNDCRKQLRAIGARSGALRALTKVLRLAASFAAAEAKPLCCEHVRAAWAELGGGQ